jgi:pyridoxal phosphate enzyme (YggS family)
MSIYDNVKRINDEISESALRSGYGEVQLMAVSKFYPITCIKEAYDAGIRIFGESRVQEALKKFEGFCAPDCAVDFVGALQRNKAKSAVNFFNRIESVDRNELISCLGCLTEGRKKPLPVLLELNSGEDTKSGYKGLDSLLSGVETALEYNGIKLCGLMTIAPFTDDVKIIRAAFRNLANARKNIQDRFFEGNPSAFSVLSMGMSNDFKIAIEEGSTLVRIGTSIFGERVY